MKYPDNITELLKHKFKNKHKEWLKATVNENALAEYSLEINLGIPTEQDALKQPEGVRAWISAWKSWHNINACHGTLVWNERRWRSLGTQSVPEKLILINFDIVAAWIGESERWTRAVGRFKLLVRLWTALLNVLPKHFNVLADYNDSDFLNLCEVLSWLYLNPNSNLYIRQIPVAGIDSKWLESRKKLVAELIAAIKNNVSDDHDFFKLSGLKQQPQLIRLRILDPDLRNKIAGLGDISAPLEEIINLEIAPKTVFIVENIQTALAFDDIKNSIVIMGLGYGVDVLEKIKCLHNARCIYWGDIDTHGFAILNRARYYLPNLETILMDKNTLLNHQELWAEEKDQHASTELPLLTNDELMLFQSLKNNVWGHHVRLEQERIHWNEVQAALAKFI